LEFQLKFNIMKCLTLWVVIALLTSAVCNLSAQTPASTNKVAKSATEKKEDKKPSAGPFHAKLAAVDKTARTITVGKRTFLITSETKFNKSGKPATLDDAVIGEPVSGYVKPNDQGKLVATKVNFGPKNDEPVTKGAPKKK
jgi:hypothetical protein